MDETELFPPLKVYLEQQGYSVYSEVKNCDIAAVKDDDLIIIELKTKLSMKLLIQAAKRKEITESVYIAVPVEGAKKYPGGNPEVKLLLRQLEIGLILVRTMKKKVRIEVLFHPLPYTRRISGRKKRAILREIDGRYAEFSTAGEPAAGKKIFAYRQEALRIAAVLKQNGEMSPKQLREEGCSVKTQDIVSKNVYGWFERVKRGVYRLHPAGIQALAVYADAVEKITREAASRRP
jgi:hypothetical protein